MVWRDEKWAGVCVGGSISDLKAGADGLRAYSLRGRPDRQEEDEKGFKSGRLQEA